MRSTPLFVGGLVETYMQTDDRSLDVKISNGWIIDGLATPRWRGDVGIRDGRYCCRGRFERLARRSIAGTRAAMSRPLGLLIPMAMMI